MTTPESFEYNDDSVVARVSFDIPGQALNDIGQLTQAMGAMRTQLEAISRAQSDWLGYLNEVPEITERANQMLREQITLLERMSYIQNEIGGSNLVGGGGTGYAGSGPGAAGGGGYSTAAPQGYVDPWGRGTPGMGMGMAGGGGNAGAAAEVERELRQISGEDPRLEANMASSRGMAVNPALLGMLGGGVAAAIGRGNSKRAGATTRQATSKKRDSSSSPDPDEGGAPDTSEPQNIDSEPHEGAPAWQKITALASQILSEGEGGKGGRIKDTVGKVGGLLRGGIGSAVGGAIGNKAGGTIKDMLMGMLKTPAGAVTAGVGAGAAAFGVAQNLGERYTQFQQLGSVQGGDAMTGMKYEAQARIMALNPFITTQQARQAMQMALKEGFRGDNYDTVQDFMIQNFKDLGVSMGQSMELMKSQVKGLSEDDDQSGVKSDLAETINTMKELSAEGGSSLPERINQLQEVSEVLASKGFSPESINRSAIGLQEGYGDSMALRDSIGSISNQVADSDMLNVLAGQQVGITGRLPGVTGKALSDAGYDQDEILFMAAKTVAGYASGFPEKIDRIGNFMMMMGQYGVSEIANDYEKAEALYDKVTGEESPVARANNRVARQGKTQTGGGGMRSPSGGPVTSSNPADADWNRRHDNYTPSENAAGMAEDFEKAGRGSPSFAPSSAAMDQAGVASMASMYSPSGNPTPPIPQSTAQVQQTINTQGVVTGEVRITVDQQGRVGAPSVIQLTGTQKAANSGYSSSQLNNAPPGDPLHNHAFNSFPSPGGG